MRGQQGHSTRLGSEGGVDGAAHRRKRCHAHFGVQAEDARVELASEGMDFTLDGDLN